MRLGDRRARRRLKEEAIAALESLRDSDREAYEVVIAVVGVMVGTRGGAGR
jgi:hypothetical protein